MTPRPENNDRKLEQAIHRTLRDLPDRRAPGSLEERVLAELERRAALPWWKRSYVHWPLPARCAFLLGSAVVLKAVIMATIWVMVGFEAGPYNTAFSSSYAWFQALGDLAGSVVEFVSAVLSTIPRFWLYAGGICLAAMYTTLIGLGAFAYRVLHAKTKYLPQ